MRLNRAETEARLLLRSQLRDGRSVKLTVSTDSMAPALIPGDLVTILPMPIEKTSPGDIVLFETDDGWMLHRLISIRSTDGTVVAVTAGDRNRHVDLETPAERFLGRCAGIIRDGRMVAIQPMRRVNADRSLLLSSFAVPEQHARPMAVNGFTDAFVAAACREGLGELIYWGRVSMLDPQPDSGPILQLKNVYLGTLARNTVYLSQLDRIDAALSGTEFILLKGAYLATSVYASPGLRRFSDIDVLVRPSDVLHAVRKLSAIGYVYKGDSAVISAPPLSRYLNSVSMKPPSSEHPSVHLHWHLVNSMLPHADPGAMNMEAIWRASWRTGRQWRALSQEHLLIHLSAHAMKHSYDRLVLIRDIAEVLRRESDTMDWARVVHDAVEFGAARAVYYAMLLIREDLGMRIPPEAIRQLAPSGNSYFDRMFLRLIRSGCRGRNVCVLASLAEARSIAARGRLIHRIIFPPRNVLAYAYGLEETLVTSRTYVSRFIRGCRAAAGSLTTQIVTTHKRGKQR